ncbi:hypothetical protein QZH41_003181 [Actinostola sp. cb2023]|nr:hypothetical protein QZH41_003181 [Actinostola sp. cb2023]
MFYDHLGNYNAVFFLSSALVCTGICAMFLIPWLVPAPLYFLDKDLLLSVDDHIETLYDSDGQYDMSYVDEQKLADLFGKKKARNLLLERASLRNSCASTRASSFVLFSIVSEDQHRDISTYTSRQELAFTSGANTPLKGTPSTRRRHFDSESRASMYSLRQSSISVDHSDLHAGQDSVDPEHAVIPLIHREIALETVEEGNELERKVSCEETKPRVEIDSAEKIQANELPEEAFSVEYDNEKDRTSWTSDSNNSLKSSGTQLSQGTVDSGYYDSAWMSSSDVDTRLSVENFIANNEKLPTDIIYRSYSWNNVSAVTSNQPTFTSISEEYIDYVEDKDFASTKDIFINSSELGNYSNTEAEYVVEAEILETVPEMVEVSSKERLPDFQKIADLDYLDDIYSLQVEKVFDEAEEYIRDKYDTCFDLKDNFRETVV